MPRPIFPSEIGKAAGVFADSFINDPLMRHFLPDDKKRKDVLPKLFRFMTKLFMRRGLVYAASDNFEGVAAWFPPGRADIPLADMLLAGGVKMPFLFGIGALGRMTGYNGFAWDMHHRLAPIPHWYLACIGVSPSCQGKGFASALIRSRLEDIDKDRLPVFLETQNPGNVPVYEHFGFKTVEKTVVPGTRTGHFAMVRGKTDNP